MQSILHTLSTTTPPSERLLRACAAFGLAVSHDPPPAPREPCARNAAPFPPAAHIQNLHARAAELLASVGANQVGLITGPSGSGKSTLLAALRLRLDHDHQPHISVNTLTSGLEPPRSNSEFQLSAFRFQLSLIDHFTEPLDIALPLLAAAGLADATLLARTPQELSEGQRARLALALSLERAIQLSRTTANTITLLPVTLLIDECAGTLDPTTANNLARTLARFIRKAPFPCRAFCATAHHTIAPHLDPQVTLTLSL